MSKTRLQMEEFDWALDYLMQYPVPTDETLVEKANTIFEKLKFKRPLSPTLGGQYGRREKREH